MQFRFESFALVSSLTYILSAIPFRGVKYYCAKARLAYYNIICTLHYILCAHTRNWINPSDYNIYIASIGIEIYNMFTTYGLRLLNLFYFFHIAVVVRNRSL